MKKYLIIFLVSGCCYMLTTFQVTAQTNGNNPSDGRQNPIADNSRNSLDWEGVYTGLLPCADCEGIRTIITLTKDLTYRIRTKYIGKKEASYEVKGKFTWNKEGNKIELLGLKEGTSPVHYLVGENKLIQLDLKGNRISGVLAEKYILKKEKSSSDAGEIVESKEIKLVGTKWKLIELRGQTVVKNPENKEYPYLQLSKDGRFSAYAGCNRMLGGYELKEGFRIRFTGVASTMMACPDMKTEQILGEVLKTVDNYSLSGSRMTLNKARMAPLAVFEVAK